MSKDNGGPAFPTPHVGGMTLRDYFAAKAMHGDFASQSAETGEWLNTTLDELIHDRAAFYYRFADAMLKERNK